MSMDTFAAIADPIRRDILRLLATDKIPVQTLSKHFPVSRPAISRHLRILREAGLVTEQKEGRQRFYRLEAERLQEIRQWITYFDKFWLDRLNDLKILAEEQAHGPDTTQHPD
jgi:DNA-binding transcriptional ArsR family regulator